MRMRPGLRHYLTNVLINLGIVTGVIVGVLLCLVGPAFWQSGYSFHMISAFVITGVSGSMVGAYARPIIKDPREYAREAVSYATTKLADESFWCGLLPWLPEGTRLEEFHGRLLAIYRTVEGEEIRLRPYHLQLIASVLLAGDPARLKLLQQLGVMSAGISFRWAGCDEVPSEAQDLLYSDRTLRRVEASGGM